MAAFVTHRAGYLPPQIVSNPGFRPAVTKLIRDVAELALPKVCASRKAFFQSELPEDEFRERVLLVEGNKVILAGIRFLNLDPRFPFIELNASFDLFEPELLGRVAALARCEFKNFEPKGIALTGSPCIKPPGTAQRWAVTIGGAAATESVPPLPAELSCSFPSSVDFYPAYCTAYAAWRACQPHLGCFVRTERKEALEASAASGLLLSCRDHEGWCGVVAAREEAFYGMPALYILEIFLAERWRGRGIARALDAALVSTVANRFPMIWEHIHSDNLPSLRVAQAQGRTAIETEYFFPFQPG